MNRLRYALSAFVAVFMLISMAAPASASTSPGLADKQAALLKLHNDARKAKCGASSLVWSDTLTDAALYHARDMADENYTGHDSRNPYEVWYKRIDRFTPYEVGGENIAYGYSTAAGAFQGWRESAGHWRNVMDCAFDRVGCGYAYRAASTYDHYWVCDFAY